MLPYLDFELGHKGELAETKVSDVVFDAFVNELAVFAPEVAVGERAGVDGAVKGHHVLLEVVLGLNLDLGRN